MATSSTSVPTVAAAPGLVRRLRSELRITDPTWWFLLKVGLIEFLVIGGTVVGDLRSGTRVTAVMVVLLVVIGGAIALSRRWPMGAICLSVGGLLVFLALGNSTDGPVPVGVMATLYVGAIPGRPWRSVAIAAALLVVIPAVLFLFHPNAGGFGQQVGGAAFMCLALVGRHARGFFVTRAERRADAVREEEAQRRVQEERLRIARELHDVVSHTISLINVQAGVAAHVIDEQPEQARQALLAIKATSRDALRELRAILGVLRQVDDAEPRSPAPGLDQLESLLEATRRAGMETTMYTRGEAVALAPAVDLAAYRIVQEALTNALRHAGPATAVVTIEYTPGQLRLEVRDDGEGTDASRRGQTPGAGSGIAGMRERAASVGGELSAEPALNRGFVVRASLPLEPA